MKKAIKFKIMMGLAPIVFILLIIVMMTSTLGGGKKETTNSGNTTVVGLSPEVLSYKSLVEKYCKLENIPDKVNIILAIMMQESGGRVPDVMQSSESLGLPVNTLQPEASIAQGVKYFASLLKGTEDEDTAIQSYNYGGGFISWLSDKGGKYSKELAVRFSDEMAIKQGWNAYGDKEYVPHVRRYLGVALDSEFAKKVMAEAVKYEGLPYTFGGVPPSAFDCSSLTQWCYGVAGVSLPRTAQMQYDSMTIVTSATEAQEGDLVFFKNTYATSDFITHVGIYLGNGKMFHAGDPIGYADINSEFWQSHLVGFGRAQ
ncbi:lysozyme family protein [Carnobacterium divergens]|uniref:bifunctional lytic transglycosylase/C40 family peptidase n=1 Tax=Carnobacterium divergens TaxID=2748 RepID=UPI0039C8DA47